MKKYLATTVLAVISLSAIAGSLTPPGAPSPTMKTLDEVEARTPISAAEIPFTINEPGSYYLTGNISVSTPNTNGIVISSGDVSLDLNGFTLSGGGPAVGTFGDGIHVQNNTTGSVVIKNGIIRDWRSVGIDMPTSVSLSISEVVLSNNFAYGISMHSGSVTGCTFQKNGVAGLFMYGGMAKDNRFQDGVFGVVTGFFNASGGVVADNQFERHSNAAIRINGGQFRLDNNTITGNGSGTGIIVAAGGCIVTRNVVTGHNTPYNLPPTCTAGVIISLDSGVLTGQNPLANYSIIP